MASEARVAIPVAFILKGYPRLSETFIAQEILGLEQAGLDIRIWSLRPPREARRHPIHAEIRAPVTYLPERLRDAPRRVLRALGRQLRRPGFARALRLLCQDMAAAPSLDRLRRFGQALVLAEELEGEVEHLHAHFLHSPASVARYAAALRGIAWSCSAHARDIWTLSEREKRAKLRDLSWLVTCTASGAAHLAALAAAPEKVELVYHGLEFSRFPPPPPRRARRDGSDPQAPVRLLSVGRAVEKKGFDLLLTALQALPASLHWHWTHIGEGERLRELQEQAGRLGLAERITWCGAQAQDAVIREYRAADLFVLPCRIAADGDRDGLPNVLMEAQTQKLACLATRLSAIPELIRDGRTGCLVPPGDSQALKDALERLIRDPDERARLGEAGHARVMCDFSHGAGLRKLAGKFGIRLREPDSRTAA